jgi:hypothetical protein
MLVITTTCMKYGYITLLSIDISIHMPGALLNGAGDLDSIAQDMLFAA